MELIEVYKCLCDLTRLRILHVLTQGPLCVCHFQSILALPQVRVSKHLAYLRRRGMVTTRREGSWIFYSLPACLSPELEANLKCLQDCCREHPIFAGDLQKLAASVHPPDPAHQMLPMKKSVLFVCIHNSARSQMAEALLNRQCPEFFEGESAGLEAGTLNPLVVAALAEEGIDIAGKATQETFDLIKAERRFDHVITVCDAASAERCPMFPGGSQRLHWSFPDPSQLTGTRDEKMAQIRAIRDAIRSKIEAFCAVHCEAVTV